MFVQSVKSERIAAEKQRMSEMHREIVKVNTEDVATADRTVRDHSIAGLLEDVVEDVAASEAGAPVAKTHGAAYSGQTCLDLDLEEAIRRRAVPWEAAALC